LSSIQLFQSHDGIIFFRQNNHYELICARTFQGLLLKERHVICFVSNSRDPAYLEYIDKIGQHFFGLPEPQRPRGMFSGIVDSLFSAMNEGEEDSPPNGRATTTATTTTTTSGGASSTHNMEAQDLD
jgi:hypothetical protein